MVAGHEDQRHVERVHQRAQVLERQVAAGQDQLAPTRRVRVGQQRRRRPRRRPRARGPRDRAGRDRRRGPRAFSARPFPARPGRAAAAPPPPGRSRPAGPVAGRRAGRPAAGRRPTARPGRRRAAPAPGGAWRSGRCGSRCPPAPRAAAAGWRSAARSAPRAGGLRPLLGEPVRARQPTIRAYMAAGISASTRIRSTTELTGTVSAGQRAKASSHHYPERKVAPLPAHSLS